MDLQMYRDEFKPDLYAFSLDEEQKQFTALPSEALEIIDENRFPIVIVVDDVPAGFFVLHKGEAISDYSANENALLLRAFSINKVQQGMGYAKAAMMLLPDFIAEHFPEIDEIVLAVNERNEAARSLYIKTGFKDTGQKLLGKKGWQSILHLVL